MQVFIFDVNLNSGHLDNDVGIIILRVTILRVTILRVTILKVTILRVTILRITISSNDTHMQI